MRKLIYNVFIGVFWAGFWIRLSSNWPEPWALIYLLVCGAALYCTISSESSPKNRSNQPAKKGYGVVFIVAVCVSGLLLLYTGFLLPPYWAELSPLIGILAIYAISRLLPDHNTEEEHEDPTSSKDCDPVETHSSPRV